MSDDPNAGGNASGGDDPLRQGSAAPPDGGSAGNTPAGTPDGSNGDQGSAGSLSGLAEGDDSGAAAAPAGWPDNWREMLAGEDPAALRALKRYGSVSGLWQKVVNQEKLISAGAHKVPAALPEDATPEEVAAYRKAHGIPEAPEGYGIAFNPDLKPSEADTALLNGFLTDMHGRNVPPGAAKAAFEWYQSQMVRTREEQAAEAARARHHVTTELRKEFGADYKRNLALADEFLGAHPGIAKLIDPARPDLDIVRDIVSLARAGADEEALYGGDGFGGGKSIDDQIKELLDKSVSGTMTRAEDARLTQLYEARVARDTKRGRAA